jgi:murein DD-endopeptidase MepM/ murein hydrolase activator NlpD
VYELDVLNQSAVTVNLLRLEAKDEQGAALLTYGQSELVKNAVQVAPSRGKLGALKPGGRAMIFCWIAMHGPVGRVKHRLSYSGASQPAEAEAAVDQSMALVLGPPLEAGDWWIGNGPSNTSEHRRAQVRKDGDSGAPFGQRYAIDFGRICEGRWYLNKGKNNTDYCAYGSKVLAVADAQVVVSKDGIPDNSPGSIAVKISKETLLGNFVVLRLGSGRLAVYAHLKPGTVLVKAGDSVLRDQEIARVGNSGNSDAPHLHFHVSQEANVDDLVLVQADPVAYMFESFQNIGTYSEKGLSSIKAETWKGDLPTEGSVIRW